MIDEYLNMLVHILVEESDEEIRSALKDQLQPYYEEQKLALTDS